jgi:quercetin dioxygenase-like cupin family protein
MTAGSPRRTDVHVRSEQSNGRVAVIETTVPADFEGPPLHLHDFDETFYVLDGELTFQLENEVATVRRGGVAFAPGRAAHTFANLSGAPARVLLVCTPAGFERVMARRAAQRAGVEPPDWALQPLPEVTVVGPRIGATRPRRRR